MLVIVVFSVILEDGLLSFGGVSVGLLGFVGFLVGLLGSGLLVLVGFVVFGADGLLLGFGYFLAFLVVSIGFVASGLGLEGSSVFSLFFVGFVASEADGLFGIGALVFNVDGASSRVETRTGFFGNSSVSSQFLEVLVDMEEEVSSSDSLFNVSSGVCFGALGVLGIGLEESPC